jgi:hypothetical protein
MTTNAQHAPELLIRASFAVALPERLAASPVATEIMWMVGGVSKINATEGTQPKELIVHVNRATAETAQAALTAHIARGLTRPYLDFDHKGEQASAWPKRFTWKDAPVPGVYVEVEWSKPGEDAIRGKAYRAFSPSFFVSNEKPAVVIGVPLNMGGLVNEPAFKNILPLWAKQATPGVAQSAPTNDNTMETTTTAPAAPAKPAAEDQAEIIRALRADRIEAVLGHQIARGIIPPQNDTIKARWRSILENDFEGGTALLNSMPTNPALGGRLIGNPNATGNGSGGVHITREDLSSVSNAYITARSPRERGLIYRKEIDPILAKRERFPFEQLKLNPVVMDGVPIQAANALGTLVGNIISQRTLALIYSRRPFLLNVVTDFSSEQARLNQTVYTRTIGLPTVQNFGTAPTDTADVDYPVALNQHKEARFQFTAAEYNSTGRDLVAEHAEALTVAIGNYMVDQVAALITAAFTSQSTGAANTKEYASITNVTKTLNVAGVPDMDRNAWVNSDVAEALRNDELVMANFDRSGEAYARWQNIEGFKEIREFPALPANAINLIAFLFHKNALLIASRISQDPQALIGAGYPGRLEVVEDPVTGLSVINNQWVFQDTLAINARLIILFGCARGNLAVGHRWVTS